MYRKKSVELRHCTHSKCDMQVVNMLEEEKAAEDYENQKPSGWEFRGK